MNEEGNLNLNVRRGVVLTAVQQRGISSSTLLLFAAIVFMVRAVMLMLGPLLVALAIASAMITTATNKPRVNPSISRFQAA
jgi:hypothetical protein